MISKTKYSKTKFSKTNVIIKVNGKDVAPVYRVLGGR